MTKGLRKTLISVLVAVLVGACVLFCLPKTTRAEGSDFGELSNEEYAFEDGMYVKTDLGEQNDYGLAFKVKALTPKYDDLRKLENGGKLTWWKKVRESKFRYSLTLCRDTGGETGEALSSLIFTYSYSRDKDDNRLWLTIVEQSFSHCQETFTCGSDFSGYFSQETSQTAKDFAQATLKNGARLINAGYARTPAFISGEKLFSFRTPSPYQRYFIKMDYAFYKCTYTGVFKTDYAWTKTKTICSASMSLYEALNSMGAVYPDFKIPGEPFGADFAETASSIVNGAEKKSIRIAYLKDIPGTPFAKEVSEIIEVPMYNEKPTIDDVCDAFGVKNLDVHDSYVYEIEKVEENYYRARYLKNCFFTGVTHDGKAFTYYLDINKSYKDMYWPMVEKGIMDEGLYELQFTRVIDANPEIKGMNFDELYGTWGFAVIPDTKTLNNLWTDLFDIESSQVGTVGMFSYKDKLTRAQYNKLLEDYEYTWAQKAWDFLVDWVDGGASANYYIFWTEPGTRGAFYKTGGADNGKGVFAKDFTKYTDRIENLTSKTFDVVFDVVDGAGDIIKNASDGIGSMFSSGFSSVLIIAGIVIFIILIRNNKPAGKKR